MAFIDCIREKVKGQILTKGQLDQLESKFNYLKDKYTKTMGDANAASEAAAQIVAVEQSRLAQKKRNTIRGVVALEQIQRNLAKDIAESGASVSSLLHDLMQKAEVRRGTLNQFLTNSMDEFAKKYESQWGGLVQNFDGIDDVIREILGVKTGNKEAGIFGEIIRKSMDLAHDQYTSAGGIMGKIKNYFPQTHNRELIKKVEFEEWYAFLTEKLDTEQMIDLDTGLPFTTERLKEVMQKNYSEITTKGLSKNKGKLSFQPSEISGRNQASRFYHFKSADDFLEYNRKFGSGDSGLFDGVLSHLDLMARETAILQTMGPTPNNLMRTLVEKVDGVNSKNLVKDTYDTLTGHSDALVSDNWLHRLGSNLREVFRSAYLGSAVISAIPDAVFVGLTAHQNGLSGTKVAKQYLKMLSSKKQRGMARRSGYIVDHISQSALAEARMTGDTAGGPMFRAMSQFVHRAGGLHGWTTMGKDIITMEFMGHLADQSMARVGWDQLNDKLRDSLFSYGIGRKEWDLIKKSNLFSPDEGVSFLRARDVSEVVDVTPELLDSVKKEIVAETEEQVKRDLISAGKGRVTKKRIKEVTDKRLKNLDKDAEKLATQRAKEYAVDTAMKLEDFNQSLRETAVNDPTLKVRTITRGGGFGADIRKGTVARLLADSVWQFKTFPLTVINRHIAPIFTGKKSAFGGKMSGKSRFTQAAAVTVGASIFGAMSLQLEQIVKGKDMRDMEDHRFWAAAYAKSGGMGLFSDFLFQDYSRFGREPITEALGPTYGFVNDFMRTFKGSIDKSLDGEPEKGFEQFKRNAFQLVRRNIPAQNLWYSRLALERLLFDTLEDTIDPKFQKRARNMERRMMRDTGQEFFWGKGDLAPERTPELAERPD